MRGSPRTARIGRGTVGGTPFQANRIERRMGASAGSAAVGLRRSNSPCSSAVGPIQHHHDDPPRQAERVQVDFVAPTSLDTAVHGAAAGHLVSGQISTSIGALRRR